MSRLTFRLDILITYVTSALQRVGCAPRSCSLVGTLDCAQSSLDSGDPARVFVQAHAQDLPLVPVRPTIRIVPSNTSDIALAKHPVDNVQSFEDTVLDILVGRDELHLLRRSPVGRDALKKELAG